MKSNPSSLHALDYTTDQALWDARQPFNHGAELKVVPANNALIVGVVKAARGRTVGRRIGPRHGTHDLGPVPGAEAESDHSHYHIHVDRGGTDHRGRGDF